MLLLQGRLPPGDGRHTASAPYDHSILSPETGQHFAVVCFLDIRGPTGHSVDDVCIPPHNDLFGPKKANKTQLEREDGPENRGCDARIQGAS